MRFSFKVNVFFLSIFNLQHLSLLFIRSSSGSVISIIIIVVLLFFFNIRFCGVAVDRVPVMLV